MLTGLGVPTPEKHSRLCQAIAVAPRSRPASAWAVRSQAAMRRAHNLATWDTLPAAVPSHSGLRLSTRCSSSCAAWASASSARKRAPRRRLGATDWRFVPLLHRIVRRRRQVRKMGGPRVPVRRCALRARRARSGLGDVDHQLDRRGGDGRKPSAGVAASSRRSPGEGRVQRAELLAAMRVAVQEIGCRQWQQRKAPAAAGGARPLLARRSRMRHRPQVGHQQRARPRCCQRCCQRQLAAKVARYRADFTFINGAEPGTRTPTGPRAPAVFKTAASTRFASSARPASRQVCLGQPGADRRDARREPRARRTHEGQQLREKLCPWSVEQSTPP